MRRLPAAVAALLALALLPPPASAQTSAPEVALTVSPAKVRYGEPVTLSGRIVPAAGGETVEIRDADDELLAAASTDAEGAFSVVLVPEGTRTFRAVWGTASSDPLTVAVRAVVAARMSAVRLFDTVAVRGSVQPARPGGRVVVELRRGGRTVDRARAEVGPAGGFVAAFRVTEPGTYRARASFEAADLLRGAAATPAAKTPLPRLSEGSTGVFVELLEGRLVELRYRLAAPNDGRYDHRTADAVVAFHKVQRMDRVFVVTAATWRALADPVEPRARRDWRGFHFEVDQTRQVLYTVEDGEITNVLHVSTGANGATRDGIFRIFRKIAGYSPNRLYYPSYFDGLRALHGWPEVPTYPASHGCVRIPYWNATWVFRLATFGTPVVVYH